MGGTLKLNIDNLGKVSTYVVRNSLYASNVFLRIMLSYMTQKVFFSGSRDYPFTLNCFSSPLNFIVFLHQIFEQTKWRSGGPCHDFKTQHWQLVLAVARVWKEWWALLVLRNSTCKLFNFTCDSTRMSHFLSVLWIRIVLSMDHSCFLFNHWVHERVHQE